jgi:hypothetical protein
LAYQMCHRSALWNLSRIDNRSLLYFLY